MNIPPFTITSEILNYCTDIANCLGYYQMIKSVAPDPILRRKNKIRTIQSSLAIEGNTLSIEQVSDILDDKRIIGPIKDIQEVKNAINIYKNIKNYNPFSIDSFLDAHHILMDGLIETSGCFRSKDVGVFMGVKVAHLPPPHSNVPRLMTELFSFLSSEKNLHPLIKSSVFHYEVEFIHPFEDGNGRMGRLWQSSILMRYHPIFEYLPIESLIKDNQDRYYDVLGQSDKNGDSTAFITFMVEVIYQTLMEFMQTFKPSAQTKESRLEIAKEHFKSDQFSRKEYLMLHKTLSTATASRDLAFALSKNMLKRFGEKSQTVYQFF